MIEKCESCKFVFHGCAIIKYRTNHKYILSCPCIECILHTNCTVVCDTRFQYYMNQKTVSDGIMDHEWKQRYIQKFNRKVII